MVTSISSISLSFRPLWGSFLFLYAIEPVKLYYPRYPSPLGSFFISIHHHGPKMAKLFPSPMGIFFISIIKTRQKSNGRRNTVSVPYGVLFISIMYTGKLSDGYAMFPSPLGIFFVSTLLR